MVHGVRCYTVLAVFLCAIVLSDAAYETCTPNWVKKGCRIDTDRGMTCLFDDRKSGQVQIDWNNLYAYMHSLACRCRAEALKLKHSWFALEEYGMCFSAPGPLDRFLGKYPLAPPNSCVGAVKHNQTVVGDDGEICFGGVMRAYFYEILNPGAPAFTEGVEGEEVAACPKVADVVFLIDVSGSVGSDNFKKVKEFLQKLVEAFNFGNGRSGSRLSIVTFDEDHYTYLTWLDSEAVKMGRIRDSINSLKYTGGSTATDKAINHVIKTIIKPFQRPKVPKTVFIITDGRCFNGKLLLPAPTKQLQALGCNVLTIGVGDDLDYSELLMLSGEKQGNILLFKTFQSLIDKAVTAINQMVQKACV